MHLVVIRRAVYEEKRWLATALSEAFQAAKQQSYDRCQEALYPLPWPKLDFEFAREIMDGHMYSYGVKPSLQTLEAATLYSYEQGLTNRKIEVSELFAPETMDLALN